MEKEIRSFDGRVEVRKAEDGTESRTIEGYAAVFDSESSTMLDWRSDEQFVEILDRDAFKDTDMTDVIAAYNHNTSKILARKSDRSTTLELEIDDNGLKYRFEAPNTTLGNDMLELIKRGDINASSFAFTVDEQDWQKREGKPDLRIIKRVKKLYDVSPVTNPAYPDTTVAKRSYDEYISSKEEGNKEGEQEKRAGKSAIEIELELRKKGMNL